MLDIYLNLEMKRKKQNGFLNFLVEKILELGVSQRLAQVRMLLE